MSRRRRPEELTIAYIALGAETARVIHPDYDKWGAGHIEFIAECTQHALMLDKLSDKQDIDGVFLYDVAEPFGHQYALALLDERDVDPKALAQEIIDKHVNRHEEREVLVHVPSVGSPGLGKSAIYNQLEDAAIEARLKEAS